MNICFIIDHLRADGAQRVLLDSVQGLQARGHRLAVLCLNDSYDRPLVDRIRAMDVEVRIVGKPALLKGYGMPAIWLWLKERRFDAVVTMLLYADMVGRPLARLAGTPFLVTSIQTRDEHYLPWQRWVVRRTAGLSDAVILNSVHVREFAITEEAAPVDRITIIPNGVDWSQYRQPVSRAELLQRLGLDPASPLRLCGTVARLFPQKGLDVLLDAYALLPRNDYLHVFIGEGDEEAALRAQAERLGLRDRVIFAGYRRDVPELLGAFDLYVHPSRFEGMPIAVIEAMAAGCPIVATAVDGTQELIESGIHGALAPAEDPNTLALAIDAMLNDPATAKARGEAAARRAREQFSIDAMVDRLEQVLLRRAAG